MENRNCTKCKRSKTVEEFNKMNRLCIECLNKSKESQKKYRQKEVFCDVCQRNIRKYGFSKHLQSDRHINKVNLKNEEEKKQKEMEEYLKDDEERIAKLKQIWKTITPKNFKRL